MKLTWLEKDFISSDLFPPFQVEKDEEYRGDLEKKYQILLQQAVIAGADENSCNLITDYSNRILAAYDDYFQSEIISCYNKVYDLVSEVADNPLAVSQLNSSKAFSRNTGGEIQFFRGRTGDPSRSYTFDQMAHLPRSKRTKCGVYRFSIPGNPGLYLCNSSYGCWIELGCPADNDFNVSPVLLDGSQKILNLAVQMRQFKDLNDFEEDRVHCWLKLLMLMIATSYRINEKEREYKSEYLISQAIMVACRTLNLDGVAYHSKRVSNVMFANCAINLALFVDYKEGCEYSIATDHLKIDDSTNYALFDKLLPSLTYRAYELASINTPLATNIGNYDIQHPYRETRFYEFDCFLFSTWSDSHRKRAKGSIAWGIPEKANPSESSN